MTSTVNSKFYGTESQITADAITKIKFRK